MKIINSIGPSMARTSVGLVLDGTEDLVTKHVEKAKVHNAFFTSVFTGKTGLQESQSLESLGKSRAR